MSVVPLQCPVCTGLIQIDVSLAGQQVACPLCQSVMSLPPAEVLLSILAQTGGMPAPPPEQIAPPPPGDVIQLACPVCAGPFQVLAAMAGQQVGCPHCASPVVIPAFEPVGMPQPEYAPPEFAPPPLPGDIGSLLPPGASGGPQFAPPSAPEPAEDPAERLPPGARPRPQQPKAQQPKAQQPKRESRPAPEDHRLPPGARPKPAADAGPSPDRLPPGARSPQSPPREEPPKRSQRDDRTPPGRSAPTQPAPRRPPADDRLPPAPKSKPKVDDLLPGAAPAPAPAPVPAPEPESVASAPAPQIDALLPPGAADVAPPQPSRIDSLLPPGASAAGPMPGPAPVPSQLDSLLPPGASAMPAATTAVSEAAGTRPRTVIDTLLPPGAGPIEPTAAAAPGTQMPIPLAPKRAPVPQNLGPGAVAVPTEDGRVVTVREKMKTVGYGDNEIELRKLTPEEKAKRRFVRNLILGAFCLAIMAAVALLMIW